MAVAVAITVCIHSHLTIAIAMPVGSYCCGVTVSITGIGHSPSGTVVRKPCGRSLRSWLHHSAVSIEVASLAIVATLVADEQKFIFEQ